MSATSRAERPIGRRYAVDRVLQRTDHLAQQVGGHLGIEGRGLQLLVPEQHLDHPDVDLLLQQVGGEAVPKVCIDTRLSIPAASAAAWMARLS